MLAVGKITPEFYPGRERGTDMSEHEAELRRRWADGKGDIVETMTWFLAAIGAQDFVDGKPGSLPHLSWYEREFLKDNAERYDRARVARMSIVDLTIGRIMAKPEPGQFDIDMSGAPDGDILDALPGPYSNSAAAELLKRANAKRVTLVDYLREAVARK
jgi:hypothetical protein